MHGLMHGVMMGRLGSKEYDKYKERSAYILPVILLLVFGVIVSYPLQSSPNNPEAVEEAPAQEQADGDTPEIEWIIDLAEGQERAKEEGKPLLAYFYSEFCYWCRKLDTEVFTNPRIVELSRQMVFVRIDADKNSELTLRFSVRYLPSMVFFSPDGYVEETVVGFQDRFQLLGLLYDALN